MSTLRPRQGLVGDLTGHGLGTGDFGEIADAAEQPPAMRGVAAGAAGRLRGRRLRHRQVEQARTTADDRFKLSTV